MWYSRWEQTAGEMCCETFSPFFKHKSNYPITIMPRYPQGDWFQDPAVPRFLGAHVSYIKCLSTVSLHTHGFCFQACMLSRFSHVWIFATPWTVARQAPLSMGFSRQVYWNGLPCPPPRDLPDPGIKPASLMSPAMAGGFFTTSFTWGASYVPLIYLSLFLTLPNLRK